MRNRNDKARHNIRLIKDAVAARHRELIGKRTKKGKFNPTSEYISRAMAEWEARGGKVTHLPSGSPGTSENLFAGSILDDFPAGDTLAWLDGVI